MFLFSSFSSLVSKEIINSGSLVNRNITAILESVETRELFSNRPRS
jgi:hypothetical protein